MWWFDLLSEKKKEENLEDFLLHTWIFFSRVWLFCSQKSIVALLSQYFLSVYFDVNAQNFYVHSSQLNFLFSLFLPLANFFFMKKEHLRNFS